MNINSTKLKAISWIFLGVSFFLIYIALISVVSNFANAVSQGQQKGLSDSELNKFSQNNILFYNPGECIDSSNSSGICGNTAEEKIWSLLRQTLDPIHAAAAFGSLSREGGFQPVKWQYYDSYYGGVVSLNTCDFVAGMNWNDLYNGVYDGKYGVGTFAITTGLSDYLHYVNDNEPDLLKYFEDPSNTCYDNGDKLAKKIGQSEVDRLIETEVNYFINQWIPKYKGQGTYNAFLSLTDLKDAAIHWAKRIEVCDECGCENCRGSAELAPRAAAARKYYDEYEDFVCDSSSDSGSSDITLIGDSMSVYSEKELQSKFPNSFFTMVGSRSISNGGFCAGDKGGLSILEEIVSGSGTIKIQHQNSNSCDDLTINSDSLKNNIVWELGTNTGGANKDNIDKVVKLAGNKNLFLVTPYNNNSNLKKTTEDIAELYRDTAKKNDNVYVVDWAKAVDGKASKYLDSSGYHPNSEGKKLLANLISNSVSNSDNSSGSSSNSGNSSSPSNSSDSNSSSSVSGSEITWIGDSLSTHAEKRGGNLISKKFPGISFGGSVDTPESYIHGGKNVSRDRNGDPAGFTILKRIIKDDELKPYLVFALGTNEGWTEANIKAFEEIMADHKDTKVILANSRCTKNSYSTNNERLQKMIDRNDNFYLADWVSAFDDKYFEESDGDECHPDLNGGLEKWVDVVADAINKASGGGCTTGEFVWYNQCDPKWADSPFGSSTVCAAGCGPTSFAMMATMLLGREITPTEAAKVSADYYVPGEGSSWAITEFLAKQYGLEYEHPSVSSTKDAIDKVNQYLKDGWMVHTIGTGSIPFTPNGHYIGIRGITSDGKWLLANSAYTEEDSVRPWDPEAVLSAGMYINNIYAIRSSSSTPCNNDKDNICGNDSGATGTETSKPIEPVHKDSTNIPCDPRTIDLGIRDDAYYHGKQYSIRLCAIPNIPDRDGNKDFSDDHNVHVNSRVSGAFYSLAEEYNKRCSTSEETKLKASEGFRTQAQQQYFYNCMVTGKCNDGALAAEPGYSNHQEGLAVDFDNIYVCKDSDVASGGWANPSFLAQFGLEDGRNFSKPERWHIQVAE